MRHRFHSICPYFAMFPEQFAEQWISRCTSAGQRILDPFAGRGTAPFQALLMGRHAVAGDINPVAYVLTGAKLDCPRKAAITRRLNELERLFSPEAFEQERLRLPQFFSRAFHHATLRQLLFLRKSLDWKQSKVDRFIAALSLGSLHGEMDKSKAYFSNQMPRTISTKPEYSLKYWRERKLWPQKRNVFEILHNRTAFRYESPVPENKGQVFLSDARILSACVEHGTVDCIITSPPYLDVTSYEEDQWLRLWFLGGADHPRTRTLGQDDRHTAARTYWSFLCDVWRSIRPLLAKKATFICRIGARNMSVDVLAESVSASTQFLAKKSQLMAIELSQIQRRQTNAFHPGTIGCRFEIDFCFNLSQ